jgi:hypothetical protein
LAAYSDATSNGSWNEDNWTAVYEATKANRMEGVPPEPEPEPESEQ